MFLIAVLGSTLTLPLISGAYASASLSPGFASDSFMDLMRNVMFKILVLFL